MVKLVRKVEILGVVIFIAVAFMVLASYYLMTEDEYCLILPVSERFSVPIEWGYDWGVYALHNDELSVSSFNAFFYHNDDLNHSDYEFHVNMKEYDRDSVSLLARMQDKSTYASCVFDKQYLAIKNALDGEETILRRVAINNDRYLVKDKKSIGIKVDGDYIQCFINETPVLHFKNANLPEHGGFGVKINSYSQEYSDVLIDSMFLIPIGNDAN